MPQECTVHAILYCASNTTGPPTFSWIISFIRCTKNFWCSVVSMIMACSKRRAAKTSVASKSPQCCNLTCCWLHALKDKLLTWSLYDSPTWAFIDYRSSGFEPIVCKWVSFIVPCKSSSCSLGFIVVQGREATHCFGLSLSLSQDF